jgi:hypothetical protein
MRNLISLLSPGARALNFPDDAILGIYSVLTRRIYHRDLAKENGTLVLLLRKIAKYWGPFKLVLENFRSEAGLGLTVVQDEGPHAVRRLLLSRQWESLRAVQRLTPAPRGTHRHRRR